MQNLRDKLLKAGLVSNEEAKRAESPPPRPPRSDRPHSDRPHPDRSHSDRPRSDRPRERPRVDRPRAERPSEQRRSEPATYVQARRAQPSTATPKTEAGPRIPKLPPLPGSREYQRLESRKQLEVDRKLLDLARTNEIPVEPGAQTFYFVTRKGRLRRLELSPEQAGKLERGELAIVERREPSQIEHALVPPAVAQEMRALADKSVRFLNTPGAAVGFLSDTELDAKKKEESERGPEEPEATAAEVPEQSASEEAASEAAAPEDAAAAPEAPSGPPEPT